MKKILVFVSIIAAMLMGGCSIMKDKDKENTEVKIEGIKTDIKDFLDDKYDKDFTIISVQGKEWLDKPSTYKVFAYPSDGDKERDRFQAERRETDDGYEYNDAYFGLKIEDEYTEMASKIISKHFDKYEIITSFGGDYFPNEYDNTKTLKDAIDEKEDIYGGVKVLTSSMNKEEFNEKVEAVSKEINTLGLSMSLGIYCSKSDDLSGFKTGEWESSMHRYIYVEKDLSVELDSLEVDE